MVVDDVEHDAQSEAVRAVDKGLEIVGRPIGIVDGEGQHAIVTPGAQPGRLGDRHELDRCEPRVAQRLQPIGQRGKGALLRRRSDMRLVDDGLHPRATGP